MLRKILSIPLDLLHALSHAMARHSRRLRDKAEGKLSKTASMGNADKWLAKLFSGLLYPFIRLSAWLDRLSLKRSATKLNSSADQAILQRRLEKRQLKSERSKRLKSSLPVRILKSFLAPFAFAWTLLKTRNRSLIWWILPVVILVGGLCFIVYQTTFVNQRRIAARYESAVAKAINLGDFDQAELFQRKLEQLGVSTDQGIYNRAQALADSGDIETAAKQMQEIATPDMPGNPKAHFWLAQHLIEAKLPEFPHPENLKLALNHLQQLKVRLGSLPEIQFMEAIALAKLGKLDESSEAFGESPGQFLEAAAAKMELDLVRRDSSAAREAAVNVQRHLSELKYQQEPLTDVQFRLDVASSQLLDDANAAALAVRQWYDSNPDNAVARFGAASLSLQKFDRWLENPDEEGVEMAAKNLEAAMQAAPEGQDNVIRQRLDSMSKRRDELPIASMYQRLIESPELSGNALEFFATAAAVKQNWERADQLFSRSVKRDSDHAVAWNNWAFVIDQAFPDRREEALKYAQKATELDSNNADFHETRGKLLLNLERWKEAVEQLEIALVGSRESKSIHASLATAYQQLGDGTKADLHRRAAEK